MRPNLLAVAPLIIRTSTVADLHALDPFADRDRPVSGLEVWVCDPTDAAVVLGSRQTLDLVDESACAEAGFGVVRRRSGGGAVLVRRGHVVWIDVVAAHGVGPDDIRASMRWVGEAWAEAVGAFVEGRVSVHEGGMVTSEWSDVVCFAGLGPGEVLVDGRKLVGLSQRRTRAGIRVQGLVNLSRSMDELTSLIRGPLPSGRPDEPVVVTGLAVDVLAARLAEALERRR